MENLNTFVTKFNTYFRTKMENIIKREKRNNDLLKQFFDRYSAEKIPSMTLSDYCFEKDKKETFCYWVDNTLTDLGEIHVEGQSGYQKFGIQKISGNYVFMRKNQKNCKFGSTKEEVYKTINKEIQKVIKAAEEMDVSTIEHSMLNEVFRAKLTYLYSRDKWIPICVTPHVDRLLKLFGVQTTANTLTAKRVELYRFFCKVKEQVPFITTWEFMNFIYSVDGYRDYVRCGIPIDSGTIAEQQPISQVQQPKIDEEREELELNESNLVDFVGVYTKNNHPENATTETRRKKAAPTKYNYQNKQKNNERKGLIGEKLIFNDEISKLLNLGIEKEVIHKALSDDSLGYDILSFDENGDEIYIEVKTTTSNRIDGFYLSAKEIEKAIEFENRYRLYRVYNLDVKEKTYCVEIFCGTELFETFKFKETNFIALFN